jgi:hypothetical protein
VQSVFFWKTISIKSEWIFVEFRLYVDDIVFLRQWWKVLSKKFGTQIIFCVLMFWSWRWKMGGLNWNYHRKHVQRTQEQRLCTETMRADTINKKSEYDNEEKKWFVDDFKSFIFSVKCFVKIDMRMQKNRVCISLFTEHQRLKTKVNINSFISSIQIFLL